MPMTMAFGFASASLVRRNDAIADGSGGLAMCSERPAAKAAEPSRRRVLQTAAAGAAAALAGAIDASYAAAPPAGLASVTEQYKDIQKGFSIFRPAGWNEFTASPDQYDVKWQDIIQPLEFVTVLTTPVTKGKSIRDLGAPEDLGKRLAQSRKGEPVAATEKEVDGFVIYQFEFKSGKAHQLAALTIAKSKLYNVNATCSENRWSRREKLFRGVLDSFRPSLS